MSLTSTHVHHSPTSTTTTISTAADSLAALRARLRFAAAAADAGTRCPDGRPVPPGGECPQPGAHAVGDQSGGGAQQRGGPQPVGPPALHRGDQQHAEPAFGAVPLAEHGTGERGGCGEFEPVGGRRPRRRAAAPTTTGGTVRRRVRWPRRGWRPVRRRGRRRSTRRSGRTRRARRRRRVPGSRPSTISRHGATATHGAALATAARRTTNPRNGGTDTATRAAMKAIVPPITNPRAAAEIVEAAARRYESLLSPTSGRIASAGVTTIPPAHPARPPHPHRARSSTMPAAGAASDWIVALHRQPAVLLKRTSASRRRSFDRASGRPRWVSNLSGVWVSNDQAG